MAKRTRTIQLPTVQEIEALYDKGDIKQLRAINERLAKTANQRMAQLFKSNIKHSTALERAQYWLYQESGLSTGGVFSRSKKLDAELLIDQIQEELIFLRSRSSTVTGEKEVRAMKAFHSLTHGKTDEKGKYKAPYMEIPSDIKVPEGYEGSKEEYFQDRFLAFLEEDYWKDIKKYLYTDQQQNNVLREAGEAIARGASLKDLKEAYKKYLANEVSIYEMWDEWTSIK